MYDICSAILAINPTAQVSCAGENLDQISWYKDTPVIPKSDIEAKMAELKADFDSKQYQRDRKPDYKSWEEQLDMMYHGTWEAHIKSVKDKYPKP